ncbi:protein SPMIP2 [Eleutherodactylus coqui]|uniref:protein SPMIP2 n=1 Tax=Eleutherodactylus coqui TaxID=57060 RepID=UPI003462182B
MHPKHDGRPSTSLSCYPHDTGKRMLYTGPDYMRDYRPKLPDYTRYIGEGMPSAESTSDVDYLCRAPPNTPAPLPKDYYVGGIGWGVSEFSFLNRSQLCSNHQIKIGEFRRDCEDKITHRYQNPWHPLPCTLDSRGIGSRATLAWTQDSYIDYCYAKSKWVPLLE